MGDLKGREVLPSSNKESDMEYQSQSTVKKASQLSLLSITIGLLASLLYFPLHMSLSLTPVLNRMLRTPIFRILRIPFIPDNEVWGDIANAIPLPIYFLGGIVLGSIGISLANKVLREVAEGNLECKYRMLAIAGKLFGVLAIMTNIFSIPVFLMQ
jgi:hypothetical protein